MENAFATFLLNSGLYDTIDVTEENIEELCSLNYICLFDYLFISS